MEGLTARLDATHDDDLAGELVDNWLEIRRRLVLLDEATDVLDALVESDYDRRSTGWRYATKRARALLVRLREAQ